MEHRNGSDETKIFTALTCLFIGFFFIWSIAADITDIYELRLDTETCNRVKTYGLTPSADCVITAPFRPLGLVPGGSLILSDGSDIQISPIAANRTGRSAEWTNSMKAQFWTALLFWIATLALLFGVFRDKE